MVILNKLDNLNIFFIKILNYLNFEIHVVNDLKLYESIRYLRNVILVKPNKKDVYGLFNLMDYGNGEDLNLFAENYIPQFDFKDFKDFFPLISDLKIKLKFAFLSTLQYHNMGYIYIYGILNLNENRKVIYIIHNSFSGFLTKGCGVYSRSVIFIHLCIPSSDLIKFIKFCLYFPKYFWTIFIKIVCFFKSKLENAKPNNQFYGNLKNNKFYNNAIIYHNSVWYGRHFKKNHYFSDDIYDDLHESKFIKFVLFQDASLNKLPDDSALIPLVKPKLKISDIKSSIFFVFKLLPKIKNLNNFYFFIFLVKFFLKYKCWAKLFKSFPNLKNVIFDFDILVPKEIIFALKSSNIKTLAIQERPTSSFCHFIYNTIVDTYFFSGKLHQYFSEKSKSSVIFNESTCLGPWRTSLFYRKDLVPFEQINLNGKPSNMLISKKRIVILGYFFPDAEYNISPIINPVAIESFFITVERVCSKFKEFEVILRMKILNTNDKNKIVSRFSHLSNFFICDDYEKEHVSYRICKEADLIISLPTSLADESLVYGKLVIFIDDLYTISKICKEIYPIDYHFAIPDDLEGILNLAQKCLNNNSEILKKYENLKLKISGDYDLSKFGVIPNTLGEYLT